MRPDVAFDLFPRRTSIGGEEDTPLLRDLNGKLETRDSRLFGEELSATLGKTPVRLSNIVTFEEDGTTHLRANITTDGLPLDREHLRYFLKPDAYEALIEEFKWRGVVEFENALIEVTRSRDGETETRFSGSLFLSNIFAWIGAPMSVRTAEIVDLDLTYESGRVRAWARVEELYGELAGRRLGGAEMLITYVQPHLSIAEFSGRFEGGELRSLGKNRGQGAGFLSVDLEDPFPFWLAMELQDVDVPGLLRGVFDSDFANQGLLSGSVRLSGNSRNLTGISGTGRGAIENSSLWAIPVFQALFAQLGFDTTATFEEMECEFNVGQGVIGMPYMRLKSPLLQLVGQGEMDLTGRLSHDLEVRYSLVDKLGPFTWFVYQLQNKFLRISIRGDLERPEVKLRGLLSGLIARKSNRETRPSAAGSERPVSPLLTARGALMTLWNRTERALTGPRFPRIFAEDAPSPHVASLGRFERTSPHAASPAKR